MLDRFWGKRVEKEQSLDRNCGGLKSERNQCSIVHTGLDAHLLASKDCV